MDANCARDVEREVVGSAFLSLRVSGNGKARAALGRNGQEGKAATAAQRAGHMTHRPAPRRSRDPRPEPRRVVAALRHQGTLRHLPPDVARRLRLSAPAARSPQPIQPEPWASVFKSPFPSPSLSLPLLPLPSIPNQGLSFLTFTSPYSSPSLPNLPPTVVFRRFGGPQKLLVQDFLCFPSLSGAVLLPNAPSTLAPPPHSASLFRTISSSVPRSTFLSPSSSNNELF